MKVALLTNFLPPYRVAFLETVAEQIGELVVLVSARSEANRDWAFDPGSLTVVEQRTVSFRGRWRARSAGFSERRSIHIPVDTIGALRRLHPDVVVSGELGLRTLLASRFCARARVPLACWATLSEDTERDLGRLRMRLRRYLARRIDHWIVNGDSGHREVRRYGARSEQISVVPYSTVRADEVIASPPRCSAAHLRLLYVGQLTDRKGILPFVAAAGRWAAANPTVHLTLTVVGKGPGLAQLHDLAVAVPFDVEILGSLTHDETLARYSNHDVLVLPTLADEWGVVVNEAMARGLTVLGSSRSQAVQEMVRDGVEGIVFDPNPLAIASALDRLAHGGPATLSAMRNASLHRSHEFCIDRIAPRLVEKLTEIQAARPDPSGG